jgi:N-acetylglucosamine-6-phosphate deacetylase
VSVETVARHYRTGRWVRVTYENATIRDVADAAAACEDVWIAPAFWDLQVNGRGGVSFTDPALTVDQVAEIVRAQGPLGTAHVCPTVITAPRETLLHAMRTIAAACDRWPQIGRRVPGIHLEGPFISPIEGFRGAHPLESVRAPDWEEFQVLQEAACGRILLITLAPETPGAIAFIRRAADSGVVVALGHSEADGPTIRAAVDAGARLSTHLGNGLAATLPRHPSALWEQAAEDGLFASLIADGHHLDPATLRVLVRAKTPRRIILVSDASPLAGLPPGRYGDWEVDPSGKIVVAGTPYLAGSYQGLETGVALLRAVGGLSLAAAIETVTARPAELLRQPAPELEAGAPMDAVIFAQAEADVRLRQCIVEGEAIDV